MKTRIVVLTVAVIVLMIISGCGTTSGTETAISSDRQEALEETSAEKDTVIMAEAEPEKQTTKTEEENKNNEDGEKQSAQEKEEEADLSKIEYATMIPDPKEYFPDAEITINDPDGGKMYAMQLTKYTKEEYDAYISE